MKEDLNKPLYADCKKQKGYGFFWSDPVISRGRSYEFADRRLMIIGWFLIIIAIGFITAINPLWRDYYIFFNVITAVAIVIITIAEFFYTRKFVYRFGRFRVKWEHAEQHPDEQASSRCDKDGNFLNTEENRVSARKSRHAFFGLYTAIIAVALLYCFVWNGLSYLRVYSWRMGEIEEAKQIAQKYDYVIIDTAGWGASVGGRTEGGEKISDEDRVRLWYIFRSLHWDYITGLNMFDGGRYIEIDIDTIFGHSMLFWYDDITEAWPAGNPSETVIQLDEHWVYVRMKDGSFF